MTGTAKDVAGRSPSGLDYDDYTRLPPAAVKEELEYSVYQAPTGETNKARDDDVPFNYKDGTDPGTAKDVRHTGLDYTRLPPAASNEDFGYDDYKAPTQSHGAGVRKDDGPYGYDYDPDAGAAGEAATSESVAGEKEAGDAPSARTGPEKSATTTVFFHEKSVRVGSHLRFRFPAANPAPLGLLPLAAAASIPFSTAALPAILALFRVPPGSPRAAAMAATLRTCEWPPLAGEAKFCASSLEALVERAMATLGTRDVRPVTSTLPRAGAPLRAYAVRAVRRVDDGGAGFFVGCHDVAYLYTVYRCHTTGPARAYMMEMEGEGGDKITVATVCHTDTSRWNPEHLSFKLLGTKPGGAPICHLMPYGHIIWAKNMETSSA